MPTTHTNVRVEKELWARVKGYAHQHKKSLQGYVDEILRSKMAEEAGRQKLTENQRVHKTEKEAL